MADGDCSLLMQCSDFQLEPQNRNGKCSADFLLTKNKEIGKNKYCGDGGAVKGSVNHGSFLMALFKTNGARNQFKGFKCQVSCCPKHYLSTSQVELDFFK